MKTLTNGDGVPPLRFAGLLRQLHELIQKGAGDSCEADSLREQTDSVWRLMDDDQKTRLSGLSEDLHALAEEAPRQVMQPLDKQAWGSTLWQAYGEGKHDKVLELLRAAPSDIPKRAICFFQARSWEGLRDPETAATFMREAAADEPAYLAAVLMLLQQAGRVTEAQELAERLLDDEDSQYEVIYFASSVLLGPTRFLTDKQARPILQRLVPALQRALSMVRRIPPAQRSIPLVETAIVCTLGLCLERIGESSQSVLLYDEALARNPANADVLTFRGLARRDSDVALAEKDFILAVKYSARSVWAYYFLAYSAISRQDYQRCLNLCASAIGRTRDPFILSQIHEWVGISRSMLNQSPESIQDSFEQALMFDPTSPHIGRNRAFAMTRRGNGQSNGEAWVLAAPQDGRRTQGELLEEQRDLVSADVVPPSELVCARS